MAKGIIKWNKNITNLGEKDKTLMPFYEKPLQINK